MGTMNSIWFVGIDSEGITHTFTSHALPTSKTHVHLYEKTYGPFETRSYAERFAEYMMKN